MADPMRVAQRMTSVQVDTVMDVNDLRTFRCGVQCVQHLWLFVCDAWSNRQWHGALTFVSQVQSAGSLPKPILISKKPAK